MILIQVVLAFTGGVIGGLITLGILMGREGKESKMTLPRELSITLRNVPRTLWVAIEGPDRSVGIFHPWLDDYSFTDGGPQWELTSDEVDLVIDVAVYQCYD